jgi:2-haloacid dehalogenase
MPASPKAYVFDAYGTLFDVHAAVRRHADLAGPQAVRISEIWRNKQLEYSWTLSLMGQRTDFWRITCDSLDFALAAVPGWAPGARDALLDAYRKLDCYEEVPAVLKALRERGARTAILSNGSRRMLDDAVAAAGLGDLLDAAISADDAGVFKTSPRVYALVEQVLGIPPAQVSFQSSNRWDIAGAAAFGFRCAWINRTGQPDEYGDLAPQAVLRDLNGLL